ncbi:MULTISPECIES: hypothetical protein [unclassified Streptomyces]|uniref:hypothetical protein n=1 Tax=unclassified Streptomyces TaxID=2593676 RepID=UPI000823D60B|nr:MULTISPECIES: hypothetical protein [unclassified Streptomyces]MYT96836.1 hypothetical protein [Streptomyces sp. SID8350]SCK63154.1 hypothetical protein YUWDRAFT_06822 [Streptomyces sp. AmelKG-D3]
MEPKHSPGDGLAVHTRVGPDYFDDPDRDDAVAAGVRLVNALRRFGVDLDSISAEKVCHTCSHAVSYAYLISLGNVTHPDADDMATQLDAFADEFERMRDALASQSGGKPVTTGNSR